MRSTVLVIAVLTLGASVPSAAEAQLFRRPFACSDCIANWFYFDHGASGAVQDWSCASSSYDGHRGSDFSLRGGLGAIDTGHDVVAGADGEVVSVQDGHYDRCTACGGTGCGLDYGYGFGNHVVVNHGAYRVVYAHMRNGSIRVSPGQRVTCGQALGQIASSGCSTGAHLHFETRPLGGTSSTAFDPFAGGCSPTSPSLFTEQGGHRSIPGPACDGTPTCPSGTYPIWTCNTEGTQRRRCLDGVDMIEDCPWGCSVMPVGTDDVCRPPPDADGDGAAADVDCNDGDASVRPGATEICGDGVDQDCAGGDAACAPDGGSMGLDASIPREDGGMVAPLDGAPALDAASGIDAAGADGAVRRPERTLEGGCACRAGGRPGDPASVWGIALAIAALLRARRRP
jgi:MYXO-CTERM domain-containing protein